MTDKLSSRLRISMKALTYYIKSEDDPGELEMILCRDDVGEVINRSDVLRMGNLEEIIEVEIPAQVEGINPGAFVGCVNLEKVKIWGTVCDVELSLGVASVSLNQADLIEELKKGERLIRIIRSPF